MFGKQKILIVDDDENIAELISLYLTKECFDTKLVYDGEDALAAFDSYQPNLILLDLMLPGIDGYQVCREIRSKAATPIIMLSAKSEVFDKVLGLELGADDYIMKPFDPKEMVARVRAVLRRYQVGQQNDTSVEKTKCAEFDGLTINLTNYSVVCDGHPVDMPPKELELLYCLAASPNQVFTREQLLDILNVCAKRLKTTLTGISVLYGELVTNLRQNRFKSSVLDTVNNIWWPMST